MEPFEKIESANAWHPQIEQDNIWHRVRLAICVRGFAFQIIHGLVTVIDPVQPYFGRFILQFKLNQKRVVGVIFNEQKGLVWSFVHARDSRLEQPPGQSPLSKHVAQVC
jgi:hypothetical protein